MTFAVLRGLHAIIGDALHDIEQVYAAHADDAPPTHKKTSSFSRVYASPPPSPSSSSSGPSIFTGNGLDFPSLDASCDPTSPSEQLTAHPIVAAAINRIVAAAGQMAASVQAPFLSLCDAGMGYHLPSCLRVLEAAHVVEILRDGPLHVRDIAARTGVDQAKLAHILRLLATHHLLRESSPDVFASNRISSLLDSGKAVHSLFANPERKYDENASAIAAFVGLCTDELFKSSAYLTEAVFPGAARLYPDIERPSGAAASAKAANAGGLAVIPAGSDPTRAPFNYAFGCSGVGYFAWLEGEGWPPSAEQQRKSGHRPDGKPSAHDTQGPRSDANPNQFRLERFGKAMAGTGNWEVPGAVLHGFDWASLPQGSVVVDVGGGIGSTTMLLASAYAELDADGTGGLRFVVQDRSVVVEMGQKAWRTKCPEFLDSGAVHFQVHDFFAPQPVKEAAVYFLRVVLHDWPDAFAQRILLRLREAAAPHTRLVIADWVLPLACVDNFGVGGGGETHAEDSKEQRQVEGAEKMLAPAPLLANLGKASANAYWMDLTMQVTFNGQERTLREIVALAASTGWKVVRVTKAPGSLFGHIVAIPIAVPVPLQRRARAGSGSAFFDVPSGAGAASRGETGEMEIVERTSSRCGTPTFGSRVDLPSVAEARARFERRGVDVGRRTLGYGGTSGLRPPPPAPLKQAAVLTAPPVRKKKPSPLSIVPLASSPSPSSLHRPVASPCLPPQATSPVARRMSQAHGLQSQQTPVPLPVWRQPPPSPMSPRQPLSRRSSYAYLSATAQTQSHAVSSPHPVAAAKLRHMPSSPTLKVPPPQHQQRSPPSPGPTRIPALTRRGSCVQLQSPTTTKRAGTGTIHPPMPRAAGSGSDGLGMTSLLLPGRASGGALDFWRGRRRDDADGDSERADDDIVSRPTTPELLPAGSVLAEAARIERGMLRSRFPDP
ncbi:O-methyltransferase [Mycena pura]|uniref:O-methyltransferase n=1 Tax=Mycena pura TaxID=153505 RepID=A0AAD6V413_9AGAR|nr:O-methyltransferase [Mycena pura]